MKFYQAILILFLFASFAVSSAKNDKFFSWMNVSTAAEQEFCHRLPQKQIHTANRVFDLDLQLQNCVFSGANFELDLLQLESFDLYEMDGDSYILLNFLNGFQYSFALDRNLDEDSLSSHQDVWAGFFGPENSVLFVFDRENPKKHFRIFNLEHKKSIQPGLI